MLLAAFALALTPGVPASPCTAPGRENRKPAQAWVTNADYPPAARRARMEGVVGFALDIDALGCPTRCEVTASSGHPPLDEATCALMMRRASFKPAKDADGKPKTATWNSRFNWRLN